MSENIIAYRQFCKEHKNIPLFLQSWWLDIVCYNGKWEVIIVYDQGKKITGVLPYYKMKSFGQNMIRIPQLTPYLGAYLNYPQNLQKQNRRYAFEKKVMSELLEQVPKFPFVVHHQPIGLDNGLPFIWQNYEVNNWYTYRFLAETPLEIIKSGMKASVRNKIDKASQNLIIEECDAPEDFYQINQLTFERQGLKMPYTLAFFKNIDQALKERGQRKIFIARDKEGLAHAAIYLVWDQQTLYNLALGGDTTLRKSGAIQLLLWEGIQLAMAKKLNFDFEGSIIESIEGVFRDFGAERVAYLRTTKYKNRWWKALSVLVKGI